MPIQLTSREYRIMAVALLIAGASLGIGVKYFWRAFPEAAIDFRVNRDDSRPIAQKFLSERGLRVDGYQHAAIFYFDDDAKVYLERTQKLDRMNQLTRGPIHLWRWSHRWFRPQQKEEFRVDVTPSGEIAGFDHEIPESAPGANLDAGAARSLAEKFLSGVMKRNFDDLEFLEAETERRPARTDHAFTWKQKSVDLGDGSWRIKVEMDGDQVAGYREFVKIPEQWTRDYERLRSHNLSAQVVDEIFWALLSVAMLIILVRRLRDRDVPLRASAGFGLAATVLYFLGRLNTFSLTKFEYRTTDSYSSFVTTYWRDSLLSALALGAAIFLVVAASEPIYREAYPGLISLRRYLTWRGLRTRSFFMANVVGIALTFFFFAYQTLFYLAADKLGAWAPSDVPFTNELNTSVPWVSVLFMGFFPAVSEEMQFRAFAIPFLKRALRSAPVALVLAALMWGFLHAAYPNQPFFIRGVEVGVGGIIIGGIMLRFGILATLIWHYSVDALYTAFLLLRSPNHYLMISGGITAGIMLVPFVAALVIYWRTGTFTDESVLTNASEGVSRPARREGVAESELALAYTPLARSRLVVAGVLTIVFVALAFVRVYRFGQGIKVRETRQQAMNSADAFLEKRNINPASYHRVAWLEDNIDPLALKYILQRRSVRDADRIYRQATRLVLWRVRYFRPVETEEHLVFVDPETGQVFGYRHSLPEDAPGATLSADQARVLGEKTVEQRGYRLAAFDLQNSLAQKRKAREDYLLVWQAKPGDPRNLDGMHYRLEVDIAGDQVVGFARYFKLPEDWVREQGATHLSNAILKALNSLFIIGVGGAAIMLLVHQVRSGGIPWRSSVTIGAAVAVLMMISELNQLTIVERQYLTSIPLNAFRLFVLAGLIVFPLGVGLIGWVLVGLVRSVYPDVWRIFRSPARRAWRRDAAVAIVVSVSAGAALSRMSALAVNRFHAYAFGRLDFAPPLPDTFSPGAGLFIRALLASLIFALLAALAIYAVRLGKARRAWWLWAGALLLLVSLGPARAHSIAEFMVGWLMGFVSLTVGAALIAAFFRDNVLAYLGAAFCLTVADPLVSLLSLSTKFFLLNGLLLAALSAIFLRWLLSGSEPHPAERGP